jgi:hypothetical protein
MTRLGSSTSVAQNDVRLSRLLLELAVAAVVVALATAWLLPQ